LLHLAKRGVILGIPLIFGLHRRGSRVLEAAMLLQNTVGSRYTRGSCRWGRRIYFRLRRVRSSLLRRFPTSNRKYVSAGSGGTALANDLFNVRSKMAELQIEKGRIENLIKEKIGDNHGMAGVATWAQAKPSRRIDAKTLREKEPEIAAKYTVEGKATRRFNFIFEPQSEE